MPLELICRANYFSPDAKRDPSIAPLEWFHNGVRRRSSRVQSGGTFIQRRWVDSNLLESRILITWTTEKDAGRWHCVDRSFMLMSAPQHPHRQVNESVAPKANMGDPFGGIANTMSFAQLDVQIIGE